MARRGSVGYKRPTRRRGQLDCKVSDDSDEDYMVGEDEEIAESEEEYCSSFVEDESEESLGKFEEEEDDEWVEKKVKIAQRPRDQPRARKGFQGEKTNGAVKRKRKKIVVHSEEEEDDDDSDDNFASTKGRKKRRVSYKEEEDEEEEGIEVAYREADSDERPRKKTMVSYKEDDDGGDDDTTRKKAKFSNREEMDRVDYDDSNDDDGGDDEDDNDDEEFLPDEIDDDEEESPNAMKNKIGWVTVEKRCIVKGRRKNRSAEVMKKTKRKKLKKKQGSTRKVRSHHGKELRDDYQVVQTKKIAERGRSMRKSTSNSDSDFVSSGSSDHEYTISEEEREQIREASEFCRSLRSSSSQMTQEKLILPPQIKRVNRKGKGKVEGIKVEVGKQICGICLSEEGKRTIRGTLNCCSHYFCFACIMEWSKVESRCPLCKQRFSTISRTARADADLGLRTQVIPVPERDQVYQPSEEERRGFLDPYENMLCIECQQGGDDAVMLLCDLCDSPAHTYCVGLGHEVPEGNWYCDGCRPTALASSGDHGTSNNLSVGSSPVASVRETFDLNELYVPDTPLSQGTEHSLSPRHSVGNFQAANSPASGTGAATVLDRRRIHRQIYQIINSRSRSERNDGTSTVSANSLFGTQVGGGREFVPGYTAPQNIYFQESLQDNATIPLQPREVLSPRFSRFRGQSVNNLASTSGDHSFGRMLHSEFCGTNGRVGLQQGPQQLHPCNGRSDINTDVGFPNQFREARAPSRTLQESVRTRF